MRAIYLISLLAFLVFLGAFLYSRISQERFTSQQIPISNQTYKNITINQNQAYENLKIHQNQTVNVEQKNESQQISRTEIRVISQNGSHMFSPAVDRLSWSLDIEGMIIQIDLGDEKIVMRLYEKWWMTKDDLENFLARLNVSKESLESLRSFLTHLNSSGWVLAPPAVEKVRYENMSLEEYKKLAKSVSGIDIHIPEALPGGMVLTIVKVPTDWRDKCPRIRPQEFPCAIALYSKKGATTEQEAEITVGISIWEGISSSDIILYTKGAYERDMRGEINARILEGARAIEVPNNPDEVFPMMKKYLQEYRSVTFVNSTLILNIVKRSFPPYGLDPLNRPGHSAWIVRYDNEKGIPVAYSVFAKYGTPIDYFVEAVKLILSS
ncbi:hypothetical protein [Candidatus Methanodesulfokora washburnensis]|jgi:hypothetical protein|uniref:Uncharacterized protein n=1 Tax=Candidatus Methanodesulfokora washburnensis TaxID=2478471 RepID=A0A429GHU0_9CREN|nr:hypothetical protein [Candidatus Methanodesulfokores washburnensis]RSN73337.1 hypothetical protein D6D85_10815 [Candidatus Methanodesulfokores washburnensis]